MVLSPKKLEILKAQAFSFPMIYIMLGYEKIDFMTFFDVRALKWPQNGPEPKKKYSWLIDLKVCPLTIAGIPITLLGDHFEIGVIFELFGTKLV